MDERQAPFQNQPPPASPSLRPSSSTSGASRSPVTEAALASIVEVRQPIRPELTRGGLVSLIPALVIAALIVMLAVAILAALSSMLFGPFGPLAVLNPFARRY